MTQRFWSEVVDPDRELLVCRVGYPLEFRILGKGPVGAKEGIQCHLALRLSLCE